MFHNFNEIEKQQKRKEKSRGIFGEIRGKIH